MSETLVIENFGPIKSANIDLRRYMVFIGTQASGKSTIAKLIAIFRNVDMVVQEEDYHKIFKNYNILNYFSNDTKFQYTNKDYSIIYFNENWQLRKSDSFIEEIKKEQSRIYDTIKSIIKFDEKLKLSTPEDQKKLINQIYEVNWKNLFKLLKEQVYIPAERILLSIISQAPFSLANVTLPECLKEFGKKFDFAKNQINNFDIEFLKISFKLENTESKIYFDSTRSILLTESASGYQACIPMLLVIEYLTRQSLKGYSFIVEEPELNLYPITQKDIVQFLVSKCSSQHKHELVITTHSPYVLSVFNNMLFAYIIHQQKNKSTSDIQSIIPSDNWIISEDFNAYFLKDGELIQIFDIKNGLISKNELDDISEDIEGKFDDLMTIYQNKEVE